MCPCVSMRHGFFLCSLALFAAWDAKILFGFPALSIARAAYMGGTYSCIILGVWLCLAVLGVYWTIAGVQAARTHVDEISGLSLAYSVGVIWICWCALQSGSPMATYLGDGLPFEIAYGFSVAWAAGN